MIETRWEVADLNLFFYDEENNWEYAVRVYKPVFDKPSISILKDRVTSALKQYFENHGIEITNYSGEDILIGVNSNQNDSIVIIKLSELYSNYEILLNSNKVFTKDDISKISEQLGYNSWLTFAWQQVVVINKI
jgi:hypothetical protein